MPENSYIKFYKETTIKDVPLVGGKNASLGEMYQKLSGQGIKVPNGFATTSAAYNYLLKQTQLKQNIKKVLDGLNTRDVLDLAKRGATVRKLIIATEFPQDLSQAILNAYEKLSAFYKISPSLPRRQAGLLRGGSGGVFMWQSAPAPRLKICRTLLSPANKKLF